MTIRSRLFALATVPVAVLASTATPASALIDPPEVDIRCEAIPGFNILAGYVHNGQVEAPVEDVAKVITTIAEAANTPSGEVLASCLQKVEN